MFEVWLAAAGRFINLYNIVPESASSLNVDLIHSIFNLNYQTTNERKNQFRSSIGAFNLSMTRKWMRAGENMRFRFRQHLY